MFWKFLPCRVFIYIGNPPYIRYGLKKKESYTNIYPLPYLHNLSNDTKCMIPCMPKHLKCFNCSSILNKVNNLMGGWFEHHQFTFKLASTFPRFTSGLFRLLPKGLFRH